MKTIAATATSVALAAALSGLGTAAHAADSGPSEDQAVQTDVGPDMPIVTIPGCEDLTFINNTMDEVTVWYAPDRPTTHGEIVVLAPGEGASVEPFSSDVWWQAGTDGSYDGLAEGHLDLACTFDRGDADQPVPQPVDDGSAVFTVSDDGATATADDAAATRETVTPVAPTQGPTGTHTVPSTVQTDVPARELPARSALLVGLVALALGAGAVVARRG